MFDPRISIKKFLSAMLLGLIIASSQCDLHAQSRTDSLDKQKLTRIAIAGGLTYAAAVIGLNEIWYKQHARSSFHLFDDRGEWENMDKYGHTFTAYMEAQWVYKGARSTGMSNKSSLITSMGLAMVFQTTIEVLDGFSSKWGFSWSDMAFNTAGVGIFGLQQHFWKEQRIKLKFSSFPNSYPNTTITSTDGSSSTTVLNRADDLFGTNIPERFIKDYNGQTYWLSLNLADFIHTSKNGIPKWLNVAVGFGAENMLGGFQNHWPSEEPVYNISDDIYPRYRQYYLSLDIDLSKIPVKRKGWRTLLDLLNVIKVPAPALEYNRIHGFKAHGLYF